MKKRIVKLLLILLPLFSCGGGQSSNTSTTLDPIYSDNFSLTVTGARADDTCTVIGEDGRELGSGSPDGITYNIGLEEAAIVQCGDLSAVFSIEDETAELTENSTAIAETLAGSGMGKGTLLIASAIAGLEDELGLSISAMLTSDRASSSGSGSAVTDSLTEFTSDRDEYLKPGKSEEEVKLLVIGLLINSGEPVVIENVGGKTDVIADCSDKEVQQFSDYAVATDASEVGLTGCLVYHSLDAVTDLNNPLGAPATNIPDSFRSVATESGLVQELIDAYYDNRTFTVDDVTSIVFTSLGHTAYSQDDEGVITTETVSSEDVTLFFKALFDTPVKSTSELEAYRFHTGYNPSGGWEINVAASLQTLSAECVDSNPDTACSVTPLHFDFDGTTLTENTSGVYILNMEYSGGFLDVARVIDTTTGKPYRDENYQPVEVAIDHTAYSAIDYANPLYEEALDPMNDGVGNSAPFSSSAWRTIYPDMSLVDNAYSFSNIEVAARLILLLDTNSDYERLSAIQAYALIKLITRGTSAITLANGTNALLEDSGKTVAEWDALVATGISNGAGTVKLDSTGKMDIAKGVVTIKSPVCWMGGSTISCTVTSSLIIDYTKPTAVSGGTQYTISGDLTIEGTAFTAKKFTPTTLVINSSASAGQFAGDSELTLSFPGSNINTKIQKGSTMNATYSLTAYGD